MPLKNVGDRVSAIYCPIITPTLPTSNRLYLDTIEQESLNWTSKSIYLELRIDVDEYISIFFAYIIKLC